MLVCPTAIGHCGKAIPGFTCFSRKKNQKNTDKTLQTTVLALITIHKFSSIMVIQIEVFPRSRNVRREPVRMANAREKNRKKSILVGRQPPTNDLVFPDKIAGPDCCWPVLASDLCSARLLARMRYTVKQIPQPVCSF